MRPSIKVVGTFEPVVFPEFSELEVTAKIDTGAYTGALHCNMIEERQIAALIEQGRHDYVGPKT